MRSLPTAVIVVVLTVAVLALVPSRVAAASPNFISGNACAGGNNNPTWRSGDTQILYGNVTVPLGCVLTIEPGAFVKADQSVHLYVHGQLLANGTSTSRISFDVNNTNEVWAGIQFNRTSRGSYIEYSTIHMAATGVRAIRSSPFLQFDLIDHAFTGVDFQDSSGWVGWTTINYTANPVRANGSLGSPVIVANTITTVLGDPSVAIYVTNVNSVTIQANTIRGMFGANRSTPAIPGARGADGGFVVGIFVNGSASGLMAGNTIDRLVGGRGGDGAPGLGNGGAGGNGGSVTALVMANTANTRMQNNAVTNLYGGHGGNGGTPGTLASTGGAGGSGGDALAMEVLTASASGWWFYNTINGLFGGSAGNGGSGSGATGGGGSGGNAYGVFAITASNANASNLGIQNVRGGYGGNSSNGAQGTTGGAGGQAGGLWILNIGGTAILGNNTIQTLTGGQGGSGRTTAGEGGAATAMLLSGDRSSNRKSTPYNLTTIANNFVSGITGGVGGLGSLAGPDGGMVVGIAAANVTLVSLKNTVQNLAGGMGGSAVPTQPAGSGGDALAFLIGLVPKGASSRDGVLSVSGGARGTTGIPPPASHGVGLYVAGNQTVTSRVSFTNGTIGSVSDLDLYLDNYTATTALNSTFSRSKLTVATAANLTVKNFLAVKAFWPNNVTLVTRVLVTVTDGLTTAFSRVIPSGYVQWIPVTNRVYAGSSIPSWNLTKASVSFGSYAFANDPRTVNMTASQTQYFTMIDGLAPTSSASLLPPWTGTRSFTVHYTYSDGNGTGVSNITLWSNLNGTGWVQSALGIPSGTGTGSFVFNAPSDGTYQFATTAYDRAGNHQAFPPSANNTWTIVDTAIPVSAVSVLPTFETSLSFTVSWGPVGTETDIAFYVIQYLHGTTWTTWLGDTSLRSALFDITALGIASPQGIYAFRSLAHTFAGLAETKTGNDTWTTVDTIPPSSAVNVLARYQTATSFGITWAPTGGTTDIANYALQVSTDGGAWTTWFSGATNTSAAFAGRDGHRYAFRSLATDNAGNVESKAGNDTWTIVDTTAPASAVSLLPQYETTTAFGIAWAPGIGTTDAVSYAVQVSADGGSWITWFSGAVNRSATFTGRDGHAYAFRSLATDGAGNTESKTVNDTWTIVDTTAPFVVSDAPEGSGVGVSPTITITFNEPMDEASVVQAFSMTPSINGNFTWNTAGSILTFTPARPLQAGTPYVVYIATTARDLAGNALSLPRTFGFTTAGVSPSGGSLSVDPLWLLVAAIAVAGVVAAIFLLRRRSAADAARATAAPKPAVASSPPEIDDVFLLYKDGILIKHETLRLRPDIDTDILSGMLTAVQQFVKDSFQSEDEGELNEITVGQMHLHIGRGKWLILAARVAGGDVATMNEQIKRCIQDMEDHHWDQLEDWDGEMSLAKVLGPYLKKLIRGDYAAALEAAPPMA